MARPRTVAAPADPAAAATPEPQQPEAPAAPPEPQPEPVDLEAVRSVAYQDGWDAGYQAGVQAGAPVGPLFEQAKLLVASLEHEPERQVVDALHDLEADLGECLAPADLELLLTQHRRAAALRRAHADELARPRERSRELAASTGQAETTYEHVS